jgi:hypothetical protein
MRIIFFLLLLFTFPVCNQAQVFGPNSPNEGENINTIGVNPWTNPYNVRISNNSRTDVTASGITNYVIGRDFGFNLLNTDVVEGIEMQIERSEVVNNLALLNPWTVGTSRPLAAGTNRFLLVIIASENAVSRNISDVKYGGVALSPITSVNIPAGSGSYEKIEAWYLLESGLATVVGTNITYSFGAGVAAANFEIVSSAVYQYVDQLIPFNDSETSSTTTAAVAYQLGQPVSTLAGSITVTGVFSGNPPSPAQALGASTAYAVNATFTEQLDFHAANAGFSTSGGVLEIASRTVSVDGTQQPAFTFSGVNNRQVALGISIRRARQMDNSVRLRKNSGIVGSDRAVLGAEWPTGDTYAVYGGPTDLWGTTWTYADVNHINFAGMLSAIVQGGTVRVDHITMTVYTSSILPVELLDFTARSESGTVQCVWITATERNTDYFLLEKSTDGIHFEPLGQRKAAGNSNTVLQYAFADPAPMPGINYYRLKSVDMDGSIAYSEITSCIFSLSTEISIYPNPANEWSTVLTPDGFEEIVITDAAGHIIERISGNKLSEGQTLALSGMPDGIYFICVRNPGEVTVKKLQKSSSK